MKYPIIYCEMYIVEKEKKIDMLNILDQYVKSSWKG